MVLEGVILEETLFGEIEDETSLTADLLDEKLFGEIGDELLIGEVEGFIIKKLSISEIDGGTP